MKLSDIVYPIVKVILEFAVPIYYKKVFFSNGNRIPKDRPVFILSNHPTAFLEPIIQCALLDKPVHPLMRGDFFQSKAAKIGLESINLIPIYRMRDGGVEGLRKNAQIFQHCYDLLAQHEQVVIMAEGFTKQQKRLAPLQKGAARMALGAAQGRKLDDLVVVPIGSNFTSANTFRGDVMIEVGEPMKISDYLVDYKKDKKGTIERLTADMTVAMKSTIVHIEDENDDDLFEQVIAIARRQLPKTLWPSWVKKDDRFRLEKGWTNKLSVLSDSEKNNLKEKVSSYPQDTALRSEHNLINWIILILGFPVWLVGMVYSFIPFTLARRIVKNKVNNIEFESPMRFGMGLLFTIIWSVLMLIIVGLVGGVKWIWLPIVMLLAIWFSVIYKDLWEVIRNGSLWNQLSKERQASALSLEQEIVSMVSVIY